MIEGLPWGAWLGIAGTGWALAASCAWLVYTGRLVPRTTLEDATHDRDEWRAAHRISEAARLEIQGRMSVVTDTATMLDQFMREMQTRLRRSKALDGGDDG